MVDLSKCQCEKPGLCPVFKRVMGSDPPNWSWCQNASTEDRGAFFKITCRSLPDYSGLKTEDIDFSVCHCDGLSFCPLFNCDISHKHRKWCNSEGKEKKMSYYQETKSIKNSIRNAINRGKVETVDFKDVLPKPKSRYAICVIPATTSASDSLNITRQSIVNYATRCCADYIELTGDQSPEWPIANKYRLHQVTKSYDKTLYLDCDVFVKSNTPNLFLITPDDKISAYDEWECWSSIGQTDWILKQQETIAHKVLDERSRNVHLDNGKFFSNSMLNGGVLVIPRSLSKYYKQPENAYPKSWCFDQNYLTLVLPKHELHRLSYKFNCTYTSKNFFQRQGHSYLLHLNNLSKEVPKRNWLLNLLINGDDIDHRLISHLDISTSKKYDWCERGVEEQELYNAELKDFVKSQTTQRYTIKDVSILCLGHSQAQFDSIKNMPYLKKINLNEIDAGAYSGNEWAESRIYFSKNSLFSPDAEFYGTVTASWKFKYEDGDKIEHFHNWPSTKILLSSKPEDKIVLCADMFCWCKWINDKSCCYGNRIISTIISPDTCNNKAIVRKFLDSFGFDRKVHKRVPYSNQIICHKSIYQSLVEDIRKNKVPEKIQEIITNLEKAPNGLKKNWDYCHKRMHAYFMELYVVAWFTMSDCKFISNTTRKQDWYNANKISERVKKWG